MTTSYEQLGLLYLGGHLDPTGAVPATERPYLLESKHLTTHAVIVGMTGSGKTGLGAVLLEEAAIDGIPAIVIDPKGDLGNLLLTFPKLEASALAPWVPAGEDPAAIAAGMAAGLAQWHQEPSRAALIEQAVERAIYTPGSRTGRGLSILQGFSAPPDDGSADVDEARRARAVALTTSLLTLAGIDGDPVQSPEHVLVASVLLDLWKSPGTPDLGQLLANIQNPPFQRLGLMAVDTVAPPAMRGQVAMRLNTALASPALQGFLEGEPLDIERLLYTPEGKPKLSILTLSHLPDELRMFFVSLLLNELLAWTRRQPGTSSLRALLYMDEVAGYLPPVAMPPSKAPLMTLLKQARAFGVGCVLATQNPVDVDYKALANAGVWYLGRLQTERDKARVLEGLQGNASATGHAFNPAAVDAALSALPKRAFFAHNVHASAPTVFQTRYALSYLRGPLTAAEVARFKSAAPGPLPGTPKPATAAPAASASAASSSASSAPLVPPGIEVRYGAGAALRPCISATVNVQYTKRGKAGLEVWQRLNVVVPFADDAPAFDQVTVVDDADSWTTTVPSGASLAALPAVAQRDKSWTAWSKSLVAAVAQHLPLVLLHSASTDVLAQPGEDRGAFIKRVTFQARELRDAEVAAVQARYATKIERAMTAVEKAEAKLEAAGAKRSAQTMTTGVDVGLSVLGALFGNRSMTTAATKAARSASKHVAGGGSVDRAEAELDAAREALAALQAEVDAALTEVHNAVVKEAATLTEVKIAAVKSGTTVERCGLVLLP
jgi:hypothetical protein